MVLAGSCQADGTCKISECFVMDVSPVIASPWGRLFQFIVLSLSGCARGFGRTSCTWNSSERKWLSSLFSVLVVSCELTVPDMLMLVNPSHVTRSFSSISQSFSLTHISIAWVDVRLRVFIYVGGRYMCRCDLTVVLCSYREDEESYDHVGRFVLGLR